MATTLTDGRIGYAVFRDQLGEISYADLTDQLKELGHGRVARQVYDHYRDLLLIGADHYIPKRSFENAQRSSIFSSNELSLAGLARYRSLMGNSLDHELRADISLANSISEQQVRDSYSLRGSVVEVSEVHAVLRLELDEQGSDSLRTLGRGAVGTVQFSGGRVDGHRSAIECRVIAADPLAESGAQSNSGPLVQAMLSFIEPVSLYDTCGGTPPTTATGNIRFSYEHASTLGLRRAQQDAFHLLELLECLRCIANNDAEVFSWNAYIPPVSILALSYSNPFEITVGCAEHFLDGNLIGDLWDQAQSYYREIFAASAGASVAYMSRIRNRFKDWYLDLLSRGRPTPQQAAMTDAGRNGTAVVHTGSGDINITIYNVAQNGSPEPE